MLIEFRLNGGDGDGAGDGLDEVVGFDVVGVLVVAVS